MFDILIRHIKWKEIIQICTTATTSASALLYDYTNFPQQQ